MGERRAKTVQKRVRLPVAISSQTRSGNPRKARRFVEMFGLRKPSFDCKEYKVNVKSNLTETNCWKKCGKIRYTVSNCIKITIIKIII